MMVGRQPGNSGNDRRKLVLSGPLGDLRVATGQVGSEGVRLITGMTDTAMKFQQSRVPYATSQVIWVYNNHQHCR